MNTENVNITQHVPRYVCSHLSRYVLWSMSRNVHYRFLTIVVSPLLLLYPKVHEMTAGSCLVPKHLPVYVVYKRNDARKDTV